jgi:hypothetical protein
VVGWFSWQSNAVASCHATMLGYPGKLDTGERMQRSLPDSPAVA